MTSVAAETFHREQEPDFYARKCRRCKQPENRCECEDEATPGNEDLDEKQENRHGS